MKRLVALSVAAVSVLAIGAGPRDARAETTAQPSEITPSLQASEAAESYQNEPQPSCDVRGMTPARARNARSSRLQIMWNPVEVAELEEGEKTLTLKLQGAGGILRGERAYPLVGVELRPRARTSRYAAEARFIHVNAGGDRVVVGLFLTEGEANPAIEPLRQAVEARDAHAISGLDPRALLPEGDARLVFADRNHGSCEPRVIWTVLDEPVHASHEQLTALLPGGKDRLSHEASENAG